jgi:hypothetical protein
MAIMNLINGALIVETSLVTVSWTEQGIAIRSPWARARSISWQDVEGVTYSESMRWFVVRAKDGTKLRVSLYLGGIGQLLEAFSRHLAAGSWALPRGMQPPRKAR